MRPNYRTLAAAVLALALVLAGAGTVLARPTQHQDSQQAQQQAILRAVHAVPDAPPVDVFVDNNLLFSNVQYKQATDYAPLAAEPHSVRVVPAGAGVQGQALIDTVVNLSTDSYNTLAVVGRSGSIRPLELVNNSTLPTINQARVRVVHASPDAPPVDVAVRGGQVLFSGISFPNASAYKVVEAKSYDLEIRQTGTNNVVKAIPNVNLNGATVYSIYAFGLANGQPQLEVVALVDAPPLPTCRTLVCPAVGAQATPRTTTSQASATPQTGIPETKTPQVTSTPSQTATAATTASPPASETPQAGTPSATMAGGTTTSGGAAATGTPQGTPGASGTPQSGMTPGATLPSGAGTSQAMGIIRPTLGLLKMGLSLAAVLGGFSLSRRLF